MTDRTRIAERALWTAERSCWWRSTDPKHFTCTITQYEVAQSVGSGKAHRMIWTWHSATDSFYRGTVPACGSRRSGADFASYARFAEAVTCQRCERQAAP